MAVLDTVILVFLGICVFVGAKNGIIRQISSIVGVVLGIFLACRYSPSLTEFVLTLIKCSGSVAKVISFVLIMIAALMVMSMCGRILENIFSAADIGWLNRLLGIVLSLAIGFILIGVTLFLLKYVDANWFPILGDSVFSDSRLAEPIVSAIDDFFPLLKKIF